MSFGKLYNYSKAPRSTMCLYIIEANKLDVEVVEAWPIKVDPSKGGVGTDYLSKFPPGKVPALERPNGFKVFECIAVSWYRKYRKQADLFYGFRSNPACSYLCHSRKAEPVHHSTRKNTQRGGRSNHTFMELIREQ